MSTLRISEIFFSLQGESTTVGLPTVFVRLTGCPLRCGYCDSEYAFSGGKNLTLDAILEKINSYKTSYVCVTGGEPLAQKDCFDLLTLLCDQGLQVSLETSGARDITPVDPRVMIVMDLKTPGSKEVDKNLWSNLSVIKKTDQIKMVLCDRHDYEWAREVIQQRQLAQLTSVLLSPSWEQLNPGLLADWIIEDALPVRFQLQLHKVLWGDVPGR